MEKFWMTPDEVREYLGGISHTTLIRYRKKGLPCTYITGNSPRYAKDDVDAWVRKVSVKSEDSE